MNPSEISFSDSSRFGQLINLAALELAFASSAAADATDGGNIDVLALRRIQQGFIGLDSDGLSVDFSFVCSPSEYEAHRSCLLKIYKGSCCLVVFPPLDDAALPSSAARCLN
jgi:hypothetical protein